MVVKERIVIYGNNKNIVQKFFQTGSFKDLEKEYDVYYLLSKKLASSEHEIFSGKNVIVHEFNKKKYFLRDGFLKTLFAFRASRYSSSYSSGFYNDDGSWARKTYLLKILGLRFLYKPLIKLIEQAIPIDNDLLEKIKNT